MRSLRRPRAHPEWTPLARTARDVQHLGSQQDLDALVLHQLQQRIRHVRVFPFEQPRAALDDRDPAAEPPHRLGEFQADVTAAENDEMFGQAFQVQGFDVRHRPRCGEAGHVGDGGAGADVDEDALAAQRPRAAGVQRHLHRFRLREARFAHDQLRAAGLELAEVDFHQFVDHLPFATGDAGHVDLHRPGHDAKAPWDRPAKRPWRCR